MAAMGSSIYFFAEEMSAMGNPVYNLWTSDGTESGTTLVKEGILEPAYMTTMGDAIYFQGGQWDGIYGQKLWKSDGTADGTTLVKDITDGEEGSKPFSLGYANVAGCVEATGEGDSGGSEDSGDNPDGNGSGASTVIPTLLLMPIILMFTYRMPPL